MLGYSFGISVAIIDTTATVSVEVEASLYFWDRVTPLRDELGVVVPPKGGDNKFVQNCTFLSGDVSVPHCSFKVVILLCRDFNVVLFINFALFFPFFIII